MLDTLGTPSVNHKVFKILLWITSQQSMLEQKEPNVPSYWGKIELTTAKISILAE